MRGQRSRHLYRYAEDALRDYPADCERLRLLSEYLAAPIGPDESGVSSRGGLAEEERVYERKLRDIEYRGLSYKLDCLRGFMNSLSDEDRRLVELRYIKGLPWSAVAEELNLSPETCMKRRAPRVVRKAIHALFGDLL